MLRVKKLTKHELVVYHTQDIITALLMCVFSYFINTVDSWKDCSLEKSLIYLKKITAITRKLIYKQKLITITN